MLQYERYPVITSANLNGDVLNGVPSARQDPTHHLLSDTGYLPLSYHFPDLQHEKDQYPNLSAVSEYSGLQTLGANWVLLALISLELIFWC